MLISEVGQFIETLNKIDQDHPYLAQTKNIFSTSASKKRKLNRNQITTIANRCFETLMKDSLSENIKLINKLWKGLKNYEKLLIKKNRSEIPKDLEELLKKVSISADSTQPLQTKEILWKIGRFLSISDCQSLLNSKLIGKTVGSIVIAALNAQKNIQDCFLMLSDSRTSSENPHFSNEIIQIKQQPLANREPLYKKLITNTKKLNWEEPESLSILPPTISILSQLTFIRADNQKLQELPASIGRLSQLKFLSLRFNIIKELPNTIGNLNHLEYLDLEGNSSLINLPKSIKNLTKLGVINIKGTSIKKEELERLKKELANCKIIS